MLKTRRNKRANRRGIYCPRCLPEGVQSISLSILALALALALFIIIDVIGLFIVVSIIVSFPAGNGNRATMGQSRGNELFYAILDRSRRFMALQENILQAEQYIRRFSTKDKL